MMIMINCVILLFIALAVPTARSQRIPNEGCPARPAEKDCTTLCVEAPGEECPEQYREASVCNERDGNGDLTVLPRARDDEFDCGDGRTCGKGGSSFADACPTNPCARLGSQLGRALFPCPRLKVTVSVEPGMTITSLNALVAQACRHQDLPDNVFPLDLEKTDFSWLAPPFVAYYVVWAVFFLVLGLFVLYKKAAEKKTLASLEGPGLVLTTGHATGARDGPQMRHMGYRTDTFGDFTFYYLVLFIISWVSVLLVTTLDNYLFFGQDRIFPDIVNLLYPAFIIGWVGTLVILVSLLLQRSVRPFFRIRCPLQEASIVTVLRKIEDNTIANENQETRIIRAARWLDAIALKVLGEWASESVPVKRTNERSTPYFEFQCIRYAFDSQLKGFSCARIHIGPSQREIKAGCAGLTSADAARRADFVGANFVGVQVPSFFKALATECSGNFYVYQAQCLWVWVIFEYWKLGLVFGAVIVISAIIKVSLNLKSRKQIKAMAEHRETCKILRDGSLIDGSTVDLVPGDIFQVQANVSVPCDAVVVEGYVIVDESMLTGESMPVQKFAVGATGDYNKHGPSKSNTLFAGTKVLQTSQEEEGGHQVLAMVESTGAHTDKGKMVRSILFPSRMMFAFNEELKVVFLILGIWGIVASAIAIAIVGTKTISVFFYAVFTISQIISPLIIAMLVVGESVAANRLVKKSIYCIDLSRITVAGKIRVFCFDKTGTLTREGLEWDAGHPILKDGERFSFKESSEDIQALPELLEKAIASAHTVSSLGETFVGPPVDIEMFKSSRWQIASQNGQNRHLKGPKGEAMEVIRTFEFEHSLMRMLVVVLDSQTNHVHVFCKGSFEMIKQLSESHSIPPDYDQVTASHARHGCYTLGVAHKDLGEIGREQVQAFSREELESGLMAIGLLLFRNKLKEDTADAIAELRSGHVRPVMITGDNALTGIHIARECGLAASRHKPIYLGDVDEHGRLFWVDVDTQERVDLNSIRNGDKHGSKTPYLVLDHKEMVEDSSDKKTICSSIDGDIVEMESFYELAVTGKAFEKLIATGELPDLLLEIRVFARMTPEGKVRCVEMHMERAIVGMCGDGGNDCGALKASHAGIALSEAEASIVSPFSSKTRSVQSCVDLVKEGRCALATSLCSYRFIVIYGEMLVATKIFGYYFSIIPSELVWIFLDGFIAVMVSAALTQSKPAKTLSRFRPTARILGVETLATLVGMFLISFAFLCSSVLWVQTDDEFECMHFDGNLVDIREWWHLGDNYEAEVVSFILIFQILGVATLFNMGFEFRAPWYRNWIFSVVISAFAILISCILFLDPNSVGCAFRINCGTDEALEQRGFAPVGVEKFVVPWGHNLLSLEAKLIIFLLALGNYVANMLYYVLVILGPVRKWGRKSRPQTTLTLVH